jgi:hypothetical protein
MSTPLCSKKRRSSIAIVALRIHSDMSFALTGSRLRSAGIDPRRLPSAAYTNVFAPMLTSCSESRSQEEPYARTAAPPPIPAATTSRAIAVTAMTAPRFRRRRRNVR